MSTIFDAGGLPVNTVSAEFGSPQGAYDTAGDSVRQPSAVPAVDRTTAPPKADAAIRNSAQESFIGLATLLNNFQEECVNKGQQDYADEYEIKFTPETLRNSTMAKSGSTVFKSTALQSNSQAKSLDPATNSTNMKSRTWSVSSGVSVIQVINEIFKNSSYVQEQQILDINELTQKVVPSEKTAAKKNLSWFQIVPVAVPTSKFDKKRNTFAYKITYYISEYAINTMDSTYFPQANYRGAHKSYNYWYTGENTAILDLVIDYNNLFTTYSVVPGTEGARSSLRAAQEARTKEIYGDLPFQPTVSPQATSGSNAQGAEGKGNEAPATAEDFLFDPSSLQTLKMTIIGDPAYLIQGTGVVSSNPPDGGFFLADGTINVTGGQVVMTLSWNAPADYNLETGLMDIKQTQKNPDGTPKNLPQVALAYSVNAVTSTFSRGKFEQVLEATLLGSLKQLQTPSGRNSSGREVTNTQEGARESTSERISTLITEPPEQTDPPQAATSGDVGSADIPNVLPSALPEPPSSDGLIFDETGRLSSIRRNTETGELFESLPINTDSARVSQLMNKEF